MITSFKVFEGFYLMNGEDMDELIRSIHDKITNEIVGKNLYNNIRKIDGIDFGFNRVNNNGSIILHSNPTGNNKIIFVNIGNLKVDIKTEKIVLKVRIEPETNNDEIDISNLVNNHDNILDNVEEGIRTLFDFYFREEKYNYVRAAHDHDLFALNLHKV